MNSLRNILILFFHKNLFKDLLFNLFFANIRNWSTPFFASSGDPINAPTVPRLSKDSLSTFGLTITEINPILNPIANVPQI